MIFDGESGDLIGQFSGPGGAFWSDGTRLFSTEEDGLHIWDVERGARTGILNGFRPQFQLENASAQIEGNTMTLRSFS